MCVFTVSLLCERTTLSILFIEVIGGTQVMLVTSSRNIVRTSSPRAIKDFNLLTISIWLLNKCWKIKGKVGAVQVNNEIHGE